MQLLNMAENQNALRDKSTCVLYAISRSFVDCLNYTSPPLWSGGHSSWLQTQRFRVRFSALPDFLRSSGSGTGINEEFLGRKVAAPV
jgi:hypothetical protein